MDHVTSARLTNLVIVKNKETGRIVDFAISADHREELKNDEKRDEYQDLARDLKKLLNRKVMVIPVDVGGLGTIPNGLVKGLEDLEIRG